MPLKQEKRNNTYEIDHDKKQMDNVISATQASVIVKAVCGWPPQSHVHPAGTHEQHNKDTGTPYPGSEGSTLVQEVLDNVRVPEESSVVQRSPSAPRGTPV